MSPTLTLHVPAMACGHCASTLRKALQDIGLPEPQVDLRAKRLQIPASSEDLPRVLAALSAAGYAAQAI